MLLFVISVVLIIAAQIMLYSVEWTVGQIAHKSWLMELWLESQMRGYVIYLGSNQQSCHLFCTQLEGNGPVESAGDRALKINAGLVVGVGDISLSAVDRVSNLRRPLSPRPFCS